MLNTIMQNTVNQRTFISVTVQDSNAHKAENRSFVCSVCFLDTRREDNYVTQSASLCLKVRKWCNVLQPAVTLSYAHSRPVLKHHKSNSEQDRQCTYDVILRRVRVTSFRVKAICITYSECVFVAFVIQPAKRMRRIILLCVASPALPHFSTYPINGTIFGKTLLNIKCLLTEYKMSFLQLLSETFFVIRRIQRGITTTYIGRRIKYPVFLSEM